MSDETLLTGGETTQVADGAVTSAGDTSSTEQQPKPGEAAPPATTTTTTDDGKPAGDGEGDGDKQGDGAPQGAPEKYEFTAPEAQSFDDEMLTPFGEVARELNLTQADAQKVLDKMAPVIAGRQEARVAAIKQEWASQSQADKEIGGDSLAENLGIAKTAMDAYASPEMKSLLARTGLGNHPEVIRMFLKIGRTISEDTLVPPKGDPTPPPSDARTLYPNSNLN